jgi:hypothetical protein
MQEPRMAHLTDEELESILGCVSAILLVLLVGGGMFLWWGLSNVQG